jgi:hypothetical protein
VAENGQKQRSDSPWNQVKSLSSSAKPPKMDMVEETIEKDKQWNEH